MKVRLLLLALLITTESLANHAAAQTAATLNPGVCGTPGRPAWCSGSDLGAWINAAIAQLPKISIKFGNGTYAYPFGTIAIARSSSTVQTFSTPVGGPDYLLTFVTMQCDRGTILRYTGSAPIWIDALDPHGENNIHYPAGGIDGCMFVSPGPPEAQYPTNTSILRFGNTQSYRVTNDVFSNLAGVGDSAVLVENTNYFTERYEFAGTQFLANNNAVTFSKNCSTADCTASFEHGHLSFYCETAYNAVNSCVQAINGAAVQYANLDINFNLVGNSGSAVIYVDRNSKFMQNVGSISGENQDHAPGAGTLLGGPGYSELNNLNAFCAACTGANNGLDTPVVAMGNMGGFPGNSYFMSYVANLASSFNTLSCRNVTGGACAAAPVIEVRNGGNPVGSVECPTEGGRFASTNLKGAVYPGNAAHVLVSGPGAGCTAPTFSVVLQMRSH
jgi:hypothetical protein